MNHPDSYKRILARMGYYDYLNGLIYRHLNQEGGWDSHLIKCRNYILKMVKYFKPKKITVLGSGWLLELPVAELLEITGEIILVDIIHPPEVVKQAGAFKNVTLIEADVTGGLIEEVWNKASGFSLFRKSLKLYEIPVPEYKPDFDPGLVISLNLLTQLESLLVDYLKKKINAGDDEYLVFRQAIQAKHIEFLMKHKSLLVSDIEEVFTDRSGEKRVVATLVTKIPGGDFSEEWMWSFDLKGADNYNSTSYMNVIARAF
jgi:hypothetical protein